MARRGGARRDAGLGHEHRRVLRCLLPDARRNVRHGPRRPCRENADRDRARRAPHARRTPHARRAYRVHDGARGGDGHQWRLGLCGLRPTDRDEEPLHTHAPPHGTRVGPRGLALPSHAGDGRPRRPVARRAYGGNRGRGGEPLAVALARGARTPHRAGWLRFIADLLAQQPERCGPPGVVPAKPQPSPRASGLARVAGDVPARTRIWRTSRRFLWA